MFSWIARTEEVDDIDIALAELKDQIPFDELKTNSLGILFFYYDADFEELCERIQKEFSFPVLGISTIAMLCNEGFVECGIEMLVMSADDVRFSVGITDEIDNSNYEKAIEELYSSLESDEKEKLILAYGSKLLKFVGDEYIKVLDRLSGGVFVYGGLAADMFTFKEFKLFYDGKIRNRALALAKVFGNVKPLSKVSISVSNRLRFEGTLTKAEGDRVYSIDNKKTVEVLKEKGLSSDSENAVMEFMQTPFVLEINKDGDDSVEVFRNLTSIHNCDGSATFLGEIPENSAISVGTLKSEDITKTVKMPLTYILDKISESTEYKYSTILCTSCTARYMNLVGDKKIEGDTIIETNSEGLNLAGFYSFGEFCPTKSQSSDREYNQFHNTSFTVLAL